MEKKFKVRVVHNIQWSYRIEFAYYYIFKNWNIIYEYINLGVDTDLSTYNPVLFGFNDAIDFAKKLKSIDDVIKFQKEEADKKIKSDEMREEWIKSHIPIKVKNIL